MQNSIAVSTWSLHRLLGISYANGPADGAGAIPRPTWGPGICNLADLPAELAQRGYFRAEICHFHLASLDSGYLHEIKTAFADSGVVIQTLLIDDGDLTKAASRRRDLDWMGRWLEAASALGAENARIIAGKSRPGADAWGLSIAGLREMGVLGQDLGVRVVTENWFDLLASATAVHRLLDALGDAVGFLADTGNWSGPTKYAELQSIFRRAELCHAKCGFGVGLAMDRDDFGSCLDAAVLAGYCGPFTLIYDGPDDDEWAGLAMEHQFVLGKLLAHSKSGGVAA